MNTLIESQNKMNNNITSSLNNMNNIITSSLKNMNSILNSMLKLYELQVKKENNIQLHKKRRILKKIKREKPENNSEEFPE